MPHGVNPTIPKTILTTLSNSYLLYSSKPTRPTPHIPHPTPPRKSPLSPLCPCPRHVCSTFPPTSRRGMLNSRRRSEWEVLLLIRVEPGFSNLRRDREEALVFVPNGVSGLALGKTRDLGNQGWI
jgi:hypothetical protein